MILGIDNGIAGGMAFIKHSHDVDAFPMPIIEVKRNGKTKHEYDLAKIVEFISVYKPEHAFIEQAQAMPGQGVSSMFTIGKNYGIVLGILAALKVPTAIVNPRVWQKVMFIDLAQAEGWGKGFDEMATALDTKQKSWLVCSKLFPALNAKRTQRCTKPHDGMTDAVCIAEYGRRLLAQG